MAARRSLTSHVTRALRLRGTRPCSPILTSPVLTSARRPAYQLPQPPLDHRPLTSSAIFRDDSIAKSSQSPASTPAGKISSEIQHHDFASVQKLSRNPAASHMLIDVREPGELSSTGRIPGSQSLPINSNADGLFLPADEFEDRFDFAKPGSETEIVFYCKLGVRARAAARLAKAAGWERVGEYPGSWVDWEENGGEVER